MDNFNETEIQGLIVRYLEGSISDQDLERLQEWVSASDEHFTVFSQAREYWLKSGMTERYQIEKAWMKLDRSLRRSNKGYYISRLSRISGYAAAILLLIGIGFYLQRGEREKEPTMQEYMTGTIEPGSKKAILVLGSNEKVELGEGRTLMEGNISIKDENNTLRYGGSDSLSNPHEQNCLITPRGGEYTVVLSDGTKVWLNAESELKYPVKFSGGQRMVCLEGEAYFSVAKNAANPFVVCSGNARITVLGTEFNVRNYKNEQIAATLVEGSVLISDDHRNERRLHPGQQAVVGGSNILVSDVDLSVFTAWKDGFFICREQSLDFIMKELSRWYDFVYFYQNQNIADIVVTAKLKKFDSVDRIFEILEETGQYKFVRNGKTITIVAK